MLLALAFSQLPNLMFQRSCCRSRLAKEVPCSIINKEFENGLFC